MVLGDSEIAPPVGLRWRSQSRGFRPRRGLAPGLMAAIPPGYLKAGIQLARQSGGFEVER